MVIFISVKVIYILLQIDLLAEISLSPRILSDVESTLKAKQIKADIDDYLKVLFIH